MTTNSSKSSFCIQAPRAEPRAASRRQRVGSAQHQQDAAPDAQRLPPPVGPPRALFAESRAASPLSSESDEEQQQAPHDSGISMPGTPPLMEADEQQHVSAPQAQGNGDSEPEQPVMMPALRVHGTSSFTCSCTNAWIHAFQGWYISIGFNKF